MAAYSAIADASETLLEILRDRITERGDVVSVERSEIALVSPGEVGADSDVRLSLYLYEVTENEILSNDGPTVEDDGTRKEPPLALDLKYLLTAYPSQGGTDETASTVDQQRVLGLAMQVLHDNAIVSSDELLGSLGERDLRISIEETPADRLTNVWGTFQDTPYRPSVAYEVSPVLVDSTVEGSITRVTGKRADFGERTE